MTARCRTTGSYRTKAAHSPSSGAMRRGTMSLLLHVEPRMRIVMSCVLTLGLVACTNPQSGQSRGEITEISNCQQREPAGLAPFLHECEGWPGIPVFTASSEHSSALAFGVLGLDRQFAERPPTGGLYSTIGPDIDWRFAEGATRPFAAIVRWRGVSPAYDEEAGDFTGETDINGNILVVAALRPDGPASACHVAYVDAAEVPYANSVARAVADQLAPGFRCGTDSVTHIDAVAANRMGFTG
mgnify:FL=1|tara:strand:- start:222 stop:947 length:726 start_codon:yes stop_codon:yes gene_type:complete